MKSSRVQGVEGQRGRAPQVAVTLGDPAGIGPEVVLKALAGRRPRGLRLVGSWAVLGETARRLGLELAPGIPIDDTGPVRGWRFGRESAACGASALASLERGVELLRRGEAGALVTAPVSKTALRLAGFRWPGQTEFLASRLGARRTAMLAWTPRYKAVLVTIHVPLARVAALVTARAVAEKTALLDEFLRRELGRRPRIGVLALNPHGAEFSLGEEGRIADGIARARRAGINAFGPIPADAAGAGRTSPQTLDPLTPRSLLYDGFVAMYHDQAMIPAKLLGPGVNVTLGLPAVRTSPLHGTAFDIAGKGVADPASTTAALRLARRLATLG